MIGFKSIGSTVSGDEILEVSLTGQLLLDCPLLNKGTAFTEAERDELGLQGLLPLCVITLDRQVNLAYEEYQQKNTDIERNLFLNSLHDTNETLFFALMQEHISEMVPKIYTPVEAAAVKAFSHIYRRPRGLFISYPERDKMDTIIENYPYPNVEAIVVTDSEAILGIGDQGVGGIGIPVGKLAIYTLCAGIHPATTLPIVLDVGTDNQTLLNEPLYLGWRHERLRGQEYDDFIEAFVQSIMRHFPKVFLQWEDFGRSTELHEAVPADLSDWTEGRVLVATGSPFPDVHYRGRSIAIGECNNCLIFPGLALGAIASQAKHITDEMIEAASRALSECSPALKNPHDALVPSLEEVREVSRQLAIAVGIAAQKAGVTEASTPEKLAQKVAAKMWTPHYARYQKV
ncbi:oxaloacetate-decarboxylating malate dehydrogenase [Pleurocapsales cyanobacterium LEGE 06147]|nr:oxaloacetate-decarboxylating malate dehydrogenase [Pleurocapsales cyanobacterium LEGE 06147]